MQTSVRNFTLITNLFMIDNIVEFGMVTCVSMNICDEMSNFEIFNIKSTKEMV